MRAGPGVDQPLRILVPLALMASVIVLGGLGMYALGAGQWSMTESFYHALNAVSTVGFRELGGMSEVRFSYLATGMIVLAGLGTVAYFQSSLTAILVQGVI